MQTRIFNVFVAIVLFLTPTLGFGHPGHGTFDGTNFWHYLTSPLHLISAMVVLGVAVIGIKYFIKKKKQTS